MTKTVVSCAIILLLLTGCGEEPAATPAIPVPDKVTAPAPAITVTQNDSKWEQTRDKTATAWQATRDAGSSALEASKETSNDTWQSTKEKSGDLWDITKEKSADAWQKTKQGSGKAWTATQKKSGELLEASKAAAQKASNSVSGDSTQQ